MFGSWFPPLMVVRQDLSSPDRILKTLVAFANTAGVTVVISVDDGAKSVRGVPGVLEAEERLTNQGTDSIRPRLVPKIDVVPWRNLNVLAVQDYPSNTRSHHLVRLGPADGVFIRVGSTNRRADALLIEELQCWNRMDPFDEQALPDLNSEAPDFRAASEFLAFYREVTPKAWSVLRITVEHQGRQVPTIGGLLLFGKDRFARFPDAWIQAGPDVLKLEEIGTHFRVTIATTRIGRPHSETKDETILALFADGHPRSTAVVARHVGLPQRATLTRLKTLKERGLLAGIGTGPHDPKRRYVRT